MTAVISDSPEKTNDPAALDAYLRLAQIHDDRREYDAAVRFYLLASISTSDDDIADYCRGRVLHRQPQHPLSRFTNVRDALEDARYRDSMDQLAGLYPRVKAMYLLDRLRSSGESGDHPFADRLKAKRPAEREQANVGKLRPKKRFRRRKRSSATTDVLDPHAPRAFEMPTHTAGAFAPKALGTGWILGVIIGIAIGWLLARMELFAWLTRAMR